MRSKLITFEGIDGAGKTSVARAVHRALAARGEEVVLTREPTATWLGEAARRAVEEGLGPLVQALLFLADRAHHVREIEAWLAEGKVVLCDRYADSTYAYQGQALEGILPDPGAWLRAVAAPFTVPPHLTFLLVLEPREALARLRDRRPPFEDEALLARVQRAYLALAQGERFVTVDASRPLPVVVEEVLGAISRRFPAGR